MTESIGLGALPFKPLSGLRVVELADWVAGPFCGRVLGWLGAEVIKLVPSDGDRLQNSDFAGSLVAGAIDDYCNGDKLRTNLNADHQLAEHLRTADVFLTDRTPGELSRLGISPRKWQEQQPERVLVSITGYGLTGPNAERPASEATVYHAGGEGYLLPGDPVYSQFPDRPPVRGGRFLADYDTGLCASLGALAALLARERHGHGDVIEISAQEVQLGLNRTVLSRCFFEQRDIDRGDRGYDYGGILPCADGFISLRPTEDQQWSSFAHGIERPDLAGDPRYATRAARDANGPELTRELESWSRTLTRAEIRELLIASGCPGGPFYEPHELLDDQALRERDLFSARPGGGEAPARLFRVQSSVPRTSKHTFEAPVERSHCDGPLAGLRVLDLTWVAAGPYATELLGFLGADVIKVESRKRPDLFRRLILAQSGDLDTSIRFVDLNQHKRSICLDLKTAAGVDVFTALAARADVVVDNYRPGVRDRLGIGDAVMRETNPDLVAVALSGFGATGSMTARPGYASVFNAESGIGALTGYADGSPTEIRDSNDLRSGTATAVAVVAALLERERNGNVCSIDVAAREALIVLQGDAVLEASRGGRPSRNGNRFEECVPYDAYATADDLWLLVCVRNGIEWCQLQQAVGIASFADPSFEDPLVRRDRRAEIDEALAAWVAEHTSDAALNLLVGAGVPAALSSPASRIRHDPHLVSRGVFSQLAHPLLGEVTVIGSPIRSWRTHRPNSGARPPLLGEHNHEILAVDLELSDDDAMAVIAAGGVES